jgi:hypothetical protein
LDNSEGLGAYTPGIIVDDDMNFFNVVVDCCSHPALAAGNPPVLKKK